MSLAQIGVGGHRALLQHFKKVFGLRLDEQPLADEIERLVLGGALPAVLRRAGFELDDLVEDVLPGALAYHGIAVLEVNPGEAEIHGGLLARFVQRQQQARGFGAVFGLERLEGFGGVVEGVIDAFATEE